MTCRRLPHRSMTLSVAEFVCPAPTLSGPKSLCRLARPDMDGTECPGRLLACREGVPGMEEDGVNSALSGPLPPAPTSAVTRSSTSLREVEGPAVYRKIQEVSVFLEICTAMIIRQMSVVHCLLSACLLWLCEGLLASASLPLFRLCVCPTWKELKDCAKYFPK
jgi:hypothetical protein